LTDQQEGELKKKWPSVICIDSGAGKGAEIWSIHPDNFCIFTNLSLFLLSSSGVRGLSANIKALFDKERYTATIRAPNRDLHNESSCNTPSIESKPLPACV
jgi:hypothetical protein